MERYDEYQVPETKEVIKWHIDINLILLWMLGIVVAGAAIFGITVGVMSSNTEIIDNRLDNDCLAITYEENRAFGKDEDLSGVYCKEQ